MTTYPDDADGAVLADLADHGLDLTQPLVIEFFIAVPDEASAKRVCEAVQETGRDAQVDFDEGELDEPWDETEEEAMGSAWTVYVPIRMVPEYHEIVRIQEELDQLARPFEGESDGWGVMVE